MENNDNNKEKRAPNDASQNTPDNKPKVIKDTKRNSGFSRSTGHTPVKIIKVVEDSSPATTPLPKEEKGNQRVTDNRGNGRSRNTTNSKKTTSSTTRKRSPRKTADTKSQKNTSAPPAEEEKKKIIAPRKSRTITKNSSSRTTSRTTKPTTSTTTKAKTPSKTKTTSTDNKTSTTTTPTKSAKTINRTVTTTHAAVDPTETGPNIIIRQTVAILIDGNNIEKSIHTMLRSKKAMLDFDTLIPKLLQNRGLNRLIYFREGLNISEKLAERLLNHYHGSVVPCHKSADIPLTITATQIADKVDTIIILSGDSDYVELVRHMKSRGVRVEIAAVKRTTASILIDEADHYVPIVKEDCFKFK